MAAAGEVAADSPLRARKSAKPRRRLLAPLSHCRLGMSALRKPRTTYDRRLQSRRMRTRRKRVIKGKVWTTVRRTTRRYFLFRPDEHRAVENLFWYCLAVAAKKHGIIVHAAILMSTHIHLVYTDVRGVQPHFKRDFHRTFAQGMKALLGWPEEVFNKYLKGEHEPLTADAIVDDIAYLIANAVSAFAVRYAKDWPGAKTLPADIGKRVIKANRPDGYFDPDNPDWPESAELRLEMPEQLIAKYGEHGARARIAEGVREYERAAHAEAQQEGIAFKGARRCLRVPRTARAKSWELFGKLNPRFKAGGDLNAALLAIEEAREFEADYDAKLARWMAGDRRVVFPHGTWWMRVHHGVRVAPRPKRRPPPS